MACFDPIIAGPIGACSPEQRATICTAYCERWHPPSWRTTIDVASFRACLDDCVGLPATEGLESPDWPQQLIGAVGQDLGALEQRARLPLALAAIIAVAVAVVVVRVT